MVRRERWVLLVTLALLQVFAVAAGVHMITKVTRGPSAPIASPKPTPTPIITAGAVLAAVGDAPLPAKGTLTARLTRALGDPALGRSSGGVVIDAATGATLFDGRADVALTPASTTKIVTAVAVLASVGPDATFATTVVTGAEKNSIVLVGGGDPTLAGPKKSRDIYPEPASLAVLASRTAKALKAAKITSVTLGYDASLFEGPVTPPGWKPTYVPEGSAAPVTALAIDEGRVAPGQSARVPDPPRAAADAFASLLGKYGIKVGNDVKPVTALKTAKELARVESPPVYALVERMLTQSDNDLAEALARHVAIQEGLPHTFAGQVAAVHRVLGRLGLDKDVTITDGSGLSIKNRITPTALARLLAASVLPANPDLHSLVSGLPIAGYTGTLHNRYDSAGSEAGAGLVRAKTGTLNGVNTLAGIAYTADGRLLAFAFMADDVPDAGAAVAALDRLATIVSQS
ncbi:D-alanyl-D-alanine carboxypeptidase/D-alanyl-D-alanine-endopeptidase [Microtetraspora sp. NBRC 16547]|uniref:D-alanyl-D-alanine carboxypeptidase/D-alanyl-D-alanine endopeptidase n=1 Tax=Microtetraspora sp. NBRC 16547 TaxID=3030993 RepID=UPI0024A5550D|nr:D-alanyl-D-alanine carboxypeptidase/D-alanyl-D-alanine-endopeptidase [Microtetraspora sp. NBRC 16547]GLX00675.1 D-alanyl-D-alanine carboxypeptidase [Microtetraspora sp. NBRC 16547]